MIDLPLKINHELLIQQLSELVKEKGYVTGNCPKERYQSTIKRAEDCDRIKHKDQKTIAGDYSYKELWMLHNLLIDYKGKNVDLAFTNSGEWCLVAI